MGRLTCYKEERGKGFDVKRVIYRLKTLMIFCMIRDKGKDEV